MPLYRHPQSPYWWVRFSVGGVKIRRSAQTADRQAAEEFEAKLRADLWRQRKLGERPRYTWGEAVDRWYAGASGRGKERDRERLKWFSAELDRLALEAITPGIIQTLRALRSAESSPSTANRYMALLRMILRKAHREWEWLDRAPAVPMYRLERTEPRYLTYPQFRLLQSKLPKHLKDIAAFSIETGLRMRNVTGLTWAQLDLRRGLLIVPGVRAKAGETLSIPLNTRALTILRAWRGAHPTYVFCFRGKPVDDVNGATFKAGAREAGVPWLRWHDLRHTWASWHVQSGTPLHVLQELGGWKSLAMVQRYAHLSADHLKAFADPRKGTARTARRPK